ncbi:MAG: hypothetical protein HY000_30820 [Planctomycetes bacterium]|nr:hypothetical protein [Planctomycetota bacterium]
MRELTPFLVVAGFVAIVATVACLAHLYEKKRSAALKALAESMSLPFFPHGDLSLVQTLSSFPLFAQGRNKTISNMIHGDTEDTDLAIFDYCFTTGSGKHKHTTRQTVVYFDSRRLSLTDFAVRPEGLFQKLGKIVGLDDIDFEDSPRFSSAFWLQGSNAAEVRKLFRSEVVQWFEKRLAVSAEGSGSRLILYQAARRTAPECGG